MQVLDLNLASRPFKNNTLLWLGHGAAILLLTAFTAWSVRTYEAHARLLDELQTSLGTTESEFLELDLRDQRAWSGIDEFDLEALAIQADKANQVIDWRAFSWTRLFNLMAEIQPYRIRMTSIRPIFRTGRRGTDEFVTATERKVIPVSIQGAAKDFAAVFELQNRLQENPQIGRVEPDRLSKIENGEYVFEMRFYYLPPGAEASGSELSASATAEQATQDPPQEVAQPMPEEDAGGRP